MRLGDHLHQKELPCHTLSTGTLLSAVLSVAKILKTADRLSVSKTPLSADRFEDGVLNDVPLDKRIQDTSELFDNEVGVHRVNNVVSKDLREAASELSAE